MKRDKADHYFSQWVRLRDRKCMRCLSSVKLNDKGLPVSHQASHFKGRAKEATRFEPLNVDCLCGACHMYFTSQPDEHYKWQVATKGQDIVDRLALLSHTYKKKERKLEAMYWKKKLKEDFRV